jgi:general nucleoside transport system permease protein
VQTMLACLLFGFADALTIQLQGVPVSVRVLRAGIVLICFALAVLIVRMFVKKIGVAVAVTFLVAIALAALLIRRTMGMDVVEIPVQFIQMIPYVVTIIVLAGFIGQSRAPKAIGIPYEKER